jgi:hypothetical protein
MPRAVTASVQSQPPLGLGRLQLSLLLVLFAGRGGAAAMTGGVIIANRHFSRNANSLAPRLHTTRSSCHPCGRTNSWGVGLRLGTLAVPRVLDR